MSRHSATVVKFPVRRVVRNHFAWLDDDQERHELERIWRQLGQAI